ncbi:MAG TPA: hypothetical protein ENO21_01985 [Firmicutes bacterium]|nr:hypothetical protein [Bacillota bacterium]
MDARDGGAPARPAGPELAGAAIAIAIDALTVGAAFWLLPAITQLIAVPGPGNIALVGGAYALMCLGVLIGRLTGRPLSAGRPADAPPAPARIRPMGCSAWFSLPFALFVIAMLMDSSGALDEHTRFGRAFLGESGTGSAYAVPFILVFIAVMVAFPLVAMIPLRPAIRRGSLTHFAGLLVATAAINVMVLVTTAYWESQLADAEPLDIAIGGKILVFLASYVVFLMFYAPPRMALAEVAGGNAARASFLIMLGIYVWRLMNQA